MNKSNYIDEVSVIVPVYKESISEAERFSLNNTIRVFERRNIVIIAPVSLKGFLEREYTNKKLVFKYFPGSYFSGISGYNSLMMSRFFYKSFSSKYLLIVQLDALVFNDDLDYWCAKEYSYVGSPLFVGLSKPSKPLQFFHGGNGGFSLRKIDDFVKVLSTPRHMPNFYTTNFIAKRQFNYWEGLKTLAHKFIFAYSFNPLLPKVNEDIFWSVLVPKYCDFFKVASSQESVAFGFDAEPNYLYELNNSQLPFGCHAWEKYDKNFWLGLSEKRILPFGLDGFRGA